MFTTTVTQTFDQLTIPLASGRVYQLRAIFPFQASHATAGVRVGLLFPAAVRAIFVVGYPSSGIGLSQGIISASGQSVLSTTGTAAEMVVTFDGSIVCSGSGNLMFFGATELANTTSRLHSGGSVIVWDVGELAT